MRASSTSRQQTHEDLMTIIMIADNDLDLEQFLEQRKRGKERETKIQRLHQTSNYPDKTMQPRIKHNR